MRHVSACAHIECSTHDAHTHGPCMTPCTHTLHVTIFNTVNSDKLSGDLHKLVQGGIGWGGRTCKDMFMPVPGSTSISKCYTTDIHRISKCYTTDTYRISECYTTDTYRISKCYTTDTYCISKCYTRHIPHQQVLHNRHIPH